MGVSGFEELDRALKRTEDAVGGQALSSAVAKGAETVVQSAKERAPRKTGKLAESISYRVGKVSASGATAKIGPKGVHYALYVELGTEKLTAKPFLRPALFGRRTAATDAIGKSLWAFIRRVLR